MIGTYQILKIAEPRESQWAAPCGTTTSVCMYVRFYAMGSTLQHSETAMAEDAAHA